MGVTGFARCIGIDFSATRDAGTRLWIAIGVPDGDRLRIEDLQPASERFGRTSLEAIDALAEFLATSADSLVACDACFGLPAALVGESWETWLLRYTYRDAEDLRAAGRAPDGRKLRRLTDRVSGAPFAPTNLRIYRQTDRWLRTVLRPLVRTRRVTVAPFQSPEPPKPHLVEVCPAVSLRRWGLTSRGYKGRDERHARVRIGILAALGELGLACPPPLARTAVDQPTGDALDSLVAVLTAWFQLRDDALHAALPDDAYREGWIYVGRPRRPRSSAW
ncbi:MAG: DUF429 domain-containing protein [Thermomicrobium sp.]|nr:DUF429 domain-containing protein [Thermomicrobium sp.]MDW8059671.1 DUF429 domain-containing protein [Thermomicrobium sp.]